MFNDYSLVFRIVSYYVDYHKQKKPIKSLSVIVKLRRFQDYS